MKIVSKRGSKEFGECMVCCQYKKSQFYEWNNIYFPDRPKVICEKVCYKCAENIVGKKNKKAKEILDVE